MYKLNIECDKDCSVELQSASEIVQVRNKNARVSVPVPKKPEVVRKDVQEILDILGDIHIKGGPRQPVAANNAFMRQQMEAEAKRLQEEQAAARAREAKAREAEEQAKKLELARQQAEAKKRANANAALAKKLQQEEEDRKMAKKFPIAYK